MIRRAYWTVFPRTMRRRMMVGEGLWCTLVSNRPHAVRRHRPSRRRTPTNGIKTEGSYGESEKNVLPVPLSSPIATELAYTPSQCFREAHFSTGLMHALIDGGNTKW